MADKLGQKEQVWITIVGLGEDGPAGLPDASRAALAGADVILGPPRHLDLIAPHAAESVPWPVPFADGLELLARHAGRRVVVLASGDPFWFGAGRAIAARFPGQWRALPGVSVFGLLAARMGWPLEDVACHGLHAAPLSRLRRDLVPGQRILATLRDGAALGDLGAYLEALGFGDSVITVGEALGGPRERLRRARACDLPGDAAHPVAVAIAVAGSRGTALPLTPGLPDDLFQTDGVMTKRALRAVTLSALAPRAGDTLWDIGGGSGTVACEWLLAHPSLRAVSLEPRADRVALIEANATQFGVAERLEVIQGHAPEALDGLAPPRAVFVGGGASPGLRRALWAALPKGARVVISAVSIETEALLVAWQKEFGGALTRIEIARPAPMGPKTGWKSAYPVVQWSVLR